MARSRSNVPDVDVPEADVADTGELLLGSLTDPIPSTDFLAAMTRGYVYIAPMQNLFSSNKAHDGVLLRFLQGLAT